MNDKNLMREAIKMIKEINQTLDELYIKHRNAIK